MYMMASMAFCFVLSLVMVGIQSTTFCWHRRDYSLFSHEIRGGTEEMHAWSHETWSQKTFFSMKGQDKNIVCWHISQLTDYNLLYRNTNTNIWNVLAQITINNFFQWKDKDKNVVLINAHLTSHETNWGNMSLCRCIRTSRTDRCTIFKMDN